MQYTQRDFLKAVLPDSGIVCVGKLRPSKKGGFLHDKYATTDAMLEGLSRAEYTNYDHYFAVASFAQESVVERGQTRFRTQSNALRIKCFILDVDIKQEEGYPHSKEAAWEQLKELCDALAMPEPLIVDSGYGYHVYWPMLGAIDAGDWQRTAQMFYKAASIITPELVADASRVSDSASVLRIPESFNLKYGKQVPVEIKQWYSEEIDAGQFRDKLMRITGMSGDRQHVEIEFKSPGTIEPAPLRGLMKNCNWSAQYLKHSATATEPEWYAMLGMAQFLTHETADGTAVGGVGIAHILSKAHPDYTHDGTVLKYTQAKNGQSGPTTCAKFQQIDKSRCEGCPFNGAVKSPIVAARLDRPAVEAKVVTTTVITDEGDKAEEEVVVPMYPKPYFRGESGGVYLRAKEKDDDGNWNESIQKIYDYDMYPVKRYRSELEEEEKLEIHLWLPNDGIRKFKLPTELLAEQKKLNTFLASRGAIAEFGSAIKLTKYMVDYTRHMQREQGAEVEYARFGWRDANSTNPKFVVGNGFIDKDGELHPAAFPSYLRGPAKAVSAHGDLDKWKEGFDIYNHIPDSEAYMLTAMIGFAAPLMALTEYAGVLYNMVGSSGAGKSTAMKVMTSIFGVPNENHVRVDDTAISTYNTIGYLSSVPVAFDEVTDMNAQAASQFALNFTGGRGKTRAMRNGQNMDNHVEWDTIVVCSSNTSMYAKFAENRKGYNAEAMRLFEVNVPSSHNRYIPVATRHALLLRDNYGHAGRAYMTAVMKRLPQVKQAVATMSAKIMRDTNATPSERFWATLLATVYVGGSLAKGIDLHTYDMAKILSWATGRMAEAKVSADNIDLSDPNSLLGEFINSNLDSMVRTNNGAIYLGAGSSHIRSVKGRLEADDGLIVRAIISTKALTDFCVSNRIDASWLLLELTRRGVTNGKGRTVRLASGTNFPNPGVYCYTFDLRQQCMELEDAAAPLPIT